MTSAKTVVSPDLYCLTDSRLSTDQPEEQVRQMIDGGARLIQFRDKALSDGAFRLAAQKCLALCRWSGTLFLVNDRVEIAASIGADGVHLGQDDMPPSRARSILGDEAVIGLSTHNREQFLRALDEPVNYIALGPIFGTTSKDNPSPRVGTELLAECAALLEGDHRPLVAIGGITLENLPEVKRAAPKAIVAVIGAIFAAPPLSERVKQFRAAISLTNS